MIGILDRGPEAYNFSQPFFFLSISLYYTEVCSLALCNRWMRNTEEWVPLVFQLPHLSCFVSLADCFYSKYIFRPHSQVSLNGLKRHQYMLSIFLSVCRWNPVWWSTRRWDSDSADCSNIDTLYPRHLWYRHDYCLPHLQFWLSWEKVSGTYTV